MDTDQIPPPGQRFLLPETRIRNILTLARFKRVSFRIPRDTMYERKVYGGTYVVMFDVSGCDVQVMFFGDGKTNRKYTIRELGCCSPERMLEVLEEVWQQM